MIRLLIVFLCFVPQFSAAQNVSDNHLYKIYWSGFKVGEMTWEEESSADKYKLTTKLSSKSIAEYFWKYSSVNTVEGVFKAGKVTPRSYHSKWWRKKEKQDIKLEFSAAGDVIEESLVPPEKVGKRPEVPAEDKLGVYDPVSAAIVSRETIRELLKNNPNYKGSFEIPTFDAKRRFDVICKVLGRKNISLDGKEVEALHITIERKPISGFRPKDLKEMAEQNRVISFYLNDDLVPIYGVAKAAVGRATIKLVN